MPANDPYQYLRDALSAIRAFASDPSVDEIETESAEKLGSGIQAILAGVQKDEEALLAGKMTPRSMARAYGRQAPAQAPAPMAGGEDPLAAILGG